MLIPRDEIAEQIVAASCIRTPRGWPTAAPYITPDDLYVPRWRNVVTASLQATAEHAWPWSKPNRLDQIAELANIPAAELRTWYEHRDTAAYLNCAAWARRVSIQAHRRNAMRALADAYNLIGEGANVQDVIKLIDEARDQAA